MDVDGAIEVTASHNPMDYNGMKLVGRGACPISGDSGLNDIRALAGIRRCLAAHQGTLTDFHSEAAHINHLLTYIEPQKKLTH